MDSTTLENTSPKRHGKAPPPAPDLQATALITAKELLAIKQAFDTGAASRVAEAKRIVYAALTSCKEHVAIVDWIEAEAHRVVKSRARAEWRAEASQVFVEFEVGKLLGDLKRTMRHVALKALGERIVREEDSAVERLARIETRVKDLIAAVEAGTYCGALKTDDPVVLDVAREFKAMIDRQDGVEPAPDAPRIQGLVSRVNDLTDRVDALADGVEMLVRYAEAGEPNPALASAVLATAALDDDVILSRLYGAVISLKSRAHGAAADAAPDVLKNRFFGDVLKFNLAAGRTMDVFNPRMIALHTGLQCEELGEKLRAIGSAMPAGKSSLFDGFPLVTLVNSLDYIGGLFKRGALDGAVEHADPVELLDGDIDQIVVSFGSMMSQGASLFGALSEVAAANLAKMVDGKLVLDANGKIQKPPGWKAPDLLPYLHASKRPPQGE